VKVQTQDDVARALLEGKLNDEHEHAEEECNLVCEDFADSGRLRLKVEE
jgi:hypothetical protein